MMSDPKSVDGETVDEVTGRLVLLIDEDRAWEDTDLMHRELATKVRHYVRHIKSDEFAAEHGRDVKDTCVRLIYSETPDADSLEFFKRVGYELKKHGVTFEHEPREFDAVTAAASVAPPNREPESAVQSEAPPTPEMAAPPTEPEEETVGSGEAEGEWEPELFLELEEGQEVEAPPAGSATGIEPLDVSSEAGGGLVEDSVNLMDIITDEPEIEVEDVPPGLQAQETQAVSQPMATVPADSTAGIEADDTDSPPSFFPEEEFGRSLQREAPPALDPLAVIETASGDEIAVDLAETLEELEADLAAKPAELETKPSLLRAIGAASTAALAGAVLWGVLAFAANHGASPLAIIVGVMVGISVRVRGLGHTTPFRVVGIVGAIVGCLLGGLLAAAIVGARADGFSISALLTHFSSVGSALAALTRVYTWTDLASVALAIYAGYRISASKAPTS